MDKTFGQIAYEAYRGFSDGVSLVTGQPIPEWDGLPEKIREAWEVAASAVRMAMNHLRGGGGYARVGDIWP